MSYGPGNGIKMLSGYFYRRVKEKDKEMRTWYFTIYHITNYFQKPAKP